MLISFSGIDSSGKSTQILKVVEYFKSRGRKTKVIWSRGGYTPLFNIFKSILRKITGDALPKPGASKHRDKTFNKKWVRMIWLDMALFDMTFFTVCILGFLKYGVMSLSQTDIYTTPILILN